MKLIEQGFSQPVTRSIAWRSTIRLGFAAVMIAGLTACATGPKNPMTAQQIKSLDIDVINVTVKPSTEISWGEGETAYAESKGCEKPEPITATDGDAYNTAAAENKPQDCDYDALVDSPEAQAFMADRLTTLLQDALETQTAPAFQGTTPARLDVEVIGLHIVSGGQAVLIGGNHTLQATLNVVEIGSGKTIAANPELAALAGYGPGGLISLIVEATSKDPVVRLSAGYASAARKWIGAEE